MVIDAFSQTDWRRFVYYARTRHRKAFTSSFLQAEGSFNFVCKGTIEGTPCPNHAVANDIHELQYLELDHCIDLLHICDVWKDCLRIQLAFQSVGMLSVIWSSELQTSWSMVFQFLQTWCCVADSKAKAFARAIGVHNILIHSNKKLTMQGLKVNAYSSVSVIGREHF